MDDLERQLLSRTWFPLARVADVERGPVAAAVLGTELVVYPGPDGPTVAQGRCPHRGMALWRGRMRDSALECPYHGWLFAPGSGACTEVPSLGPGVPLPHARLATFPVQVAYGHVWSTLRDPFLPMPELLEYDESTWQVAFGEPQEVACGMRQITENFRDMAHFPFVHTGTMGPQVRRQVDRYEVERVADGLQWTLATDLGGTALNGNAALGTGQTLTYRLALPMTTYIRTRFPDGGRRLVAQFATPITADGSRVKLFWLVGIDDIVVREHGVDLGEMWRYERDIFAEDIPIVENQWPAEAPLDPHAQVHTSADRFSLAYRAAYRELLERFARSGSPVAAAAGGNP